MKWWKWVLLVLAVAFLVVQFVRPAETNPPIDATKTIEAAGIVPADVDAILNRSCSDCHSNKTVWPWYAQVAPVSWLLVKDVNQGRKQLNLSEWAGYTARRKARKLKELCEQVKGGDMPLKFYLPLHPTAKLSDADRARLCEWASSVHIDAAAKPAS